MLYVVVYDISDGKRLHRVARVCEDYGIRMEKSVFECRLGRRDFSRMWEQLSRIAVEDEGDRIIVYPIGTSEERHVLQIGVKRMTERVETYVF